MLDVDWFYFFAIGSWFCLLLKARGISMVSVLVESI